MESNSRNIYKNARRSTGFTQEQWAEAIGVSVDSVRNYEAGTQVPSDEVVLTMCEISGVLVLAYQHMERKSPLAEQLLPYVEAVPLPQAVCFLAWAIRDFAKRHREDELLDIAADGRIDAVERPVFDAIVKEMKDGIVKAALQLECAE